MKIINEIKKGRNRHWKNFIDKDYLGSHNLEEREEMILTIEKVVGNELVENHKNHSKENKIVLYFREPVPKMILNITNAESIEKLYGSHIEKWENKKIQLYTVKIKAFGKIQDALRVRDIVPREEIDEKEAFDRLKKAKTLSNLKGIWIGFPATLRNKKKFKDLKDLLKEKLTKK